MTITQLEPNGSFSPATIDVSSKSMDEHHPRPEGTIHKESDQPTLRYDPVAIADYYRSRLFQVWGRLFRIIWKFGSFALGLWFDGKRGKKLKPRENGQFNCELY